jgi:hypothetical protein
VRDVLKLLVAEEEFNSAPFRLGRLGERTTGTRAGPMAISGMLDRLGLAVMYRDAGRRAASALDWTTSELTIVTRVPQPAANTANLRL